VVRRRFLKRHLGVGTRAITSAGDVIHRLEEERLGIRASKRWVCGNKGNMDGEQNTDASHEVGDQHETKPLPSLVHKRPEEMDYAEFGCTRGAGLRLDWRRAFLSLGDAATPCHSVGKPVNIPVIVSYPTWTRWTKFVGFPIGDESALRR